MALSNTVLRDLIYAQINSQLGGVPKKAVKIVEKFSMAIATAVVTHIQENAEITVNVQTNTPVTSANAGLQRLPVTIVAGATTVAPLVTQTLTGTGTGTGTIK